MPFSVSNQFWSDLNSRQGLPSSAFLIRKAESRCGACGFLSSASAPTTRHVFRALFVNIYINYIGNIGGLIHRCRMNGELPKTPLIKNDGFTTLRHIHRLAAIWLRISALFSFLTLMKFKFRAKRTNSWPQAIFYFAFFFEIKSRKRKTSMIIMD